MAGGGGWVLPGRVLFIHLLLSPQECTLKVQEGKFKLQDLLVVPMQRVLKYHLLLKVRPSACSPCPLSCRALMAWALAHRQGAHRRSTHHQGVSWQLEGKNKLATLGKRDETGKHPWTRTRRATVLNRLVSELPCKALL